MRFVWTTPSAVSQVLDYKDGVLSNHGGNNNTLTVPWVLECDVPLGGSHDHDGQLTKLHRVWFL